MAQSAFQELPELEELLGLDFETRFLLRRRALALAHSWLARHREGARRALDTLELQSDAQRAAAELIRAEDTVISPAMEPRCLKGWKTDDKWIKNG